MREETRMKAESVVEKNDVLWCQVQGCWEDLLPQQSWCGEPICALHLAEHAVAENRVLGTRLLALHERGRYLEERVLRLENELATKAVQLAERTCRGSLARL